ncbi:ankyrin repeat domain-containing protein [Psychroserpens sp. NJDZ02]|uniref:ankyrin repeat domain-containing protein n=1 Tax=Psychroserpens sp. NJDZ02 TaxID=2570561 RepID=UPI0010A7BA92|nr:ankyrin repeat domain-containing protein [Psychroserpens sp. NJDZ02]QCE41354.1 ankyrin repeat domain-containing protein [Psychroserpens sp. NJDZ02]
MKKIIAISLLLVSITVSAQDNVFLSRGFWNPSVTIDAVKAQVDAGNNPSELNDNNFDPVVYAILQSAPNEVIEYMVSLEGNDVNKLTHDGRTYIFWAAYTGNDTIMEYFISKGAKTDILDDHGMTVLNFAANAGQTNTKVYDICIANGADLKNDVNHDGANALLLAAPNDIRLTGYFIYKGLSDKSVDNNGNGIFNYVAKTGDLELLKGLIKEGKKGTDQAFIFASKGTKGKTNGLDVYNYLESVGLNPKTKTTEGITPLHNVASRNKDLAVINYFIEKGNSVNDADKNGNTPFLNAASNNDITIVTSLLEQVESIDFTNKKGQSALMLAVKNNSHDVVKLLLDKGAKTDVADSNGNNIAYYLVESYNPKKEANFKTKLQLLEGNGFDFATPQKNGNTLLHIALDKNDVDFLKQINQFDVDVNTVNKEGYTALHLAAMKATNTTIIRYLLSIGADKTIKTSFDEGVFDLASENEILMSNQVTLDFLK